MSIDKTFRSGITKYCTYNAEFFRKLADHMDDAGIKELEFDTSIEYSEYSKDQYAALEVIAYKK